MALDHVVGQPTRLVVDLSVDLGVALELCSRHPLRDVLEEREHLDEVLARGVRLVHDLDHRLSQADVFVSGIRRLNTVDDTQYRGPENAAWATQPRA